MKTIKRLSILMQLVTLILALGILWSVWRLGFVLVVVFFGIFVWLEVTGP